MDRPTIEIILPESKSKVSMYTYLTSGQYREIQKSLLKEVKVDPNKGQDQKIGEISADVVFEQQDAICKFLIKEISDNEGKKIDDIGAFIYDLSIKDGNTLYAKVNEIDSNSRLGAEGKKK